MRSERKERLLDQLELQLEDAEAAATEDELAAERSARLVQGKSFERKRPSRKPFPAHLPRQRVVIAAPSACPCCGSARLSKLGEDVTETLEIVPRTWKVIQTVRERFSCRDCETITQPPAPFHPIPRGLAGPSLLAMSRQMRSICPDPVREVRPASAAEPAGRALRPRGYRPQPFDAGRSCRRLRGRPGSAARVDRSPCLCRAAPAWRRYDGSHSGQGQDRYGAHLGLCPQRSPFGGQGPPAALFYASRDRTAEHPERHLSHWSGILQADAYSGYNRLYQPERKPGRIVEALCWSHARRKFFELADIAANARRGKNAPAISPMALEAVKRIDVIFDVERDINGSSAEDRLRVRRETSAPLVATLETWLRVERAKLSRHGAIAKAMDYMLTRWPAFTRFLADGRICLTNNAAERALRGLALGRKSWLFAGSQRGAERAAVMYTLIQTAKLNNIDPQAWLADVLARIADIPQTRLSQLLPWNWREAAPTQKAA